MTEAGPVLTMSLAFAKKPFPTKSGSCGTVVRNAKLKVIDTKTGSSLGYNQTGEICICGSQIMKGIFLPYFHLLPYIYIHKYDDSYVCI